MRFLRGQRSLALALVVTSVFAAICESAILALLAEVAASLVTRSPIAVFQLGPLHADARIRLLLAVGLSLALFRIALQAVLAYFPARICADFQANMRNRLFREFTQASWAEKSTDREGSFQEISTSQVIQATQGVMQATIVLTSGVMLVVLVLSALVVEPFSALAVIGAAFLLFLLMRPLNAVGSRHSRALSRAQVEYAAGLSEAVNLAEEAQVFGTGQAQQRQINRLVDAARRRFFSAQYVGRLVSGGYQAILLLLLLLGLLVLDSTDAAHIASLGAVVLLLVRASTYGQQAQGAYHYMGQAEPFITRLHEAERKYRDAPIARGTNRMTGVPRIELRSASYTYPSGREALHDISFELSPGEVVGVVGPSGAGKSTLVQVLLGLRNPTSGSYIVNGRNALSWSDESWVETFAYLGQDSRIFHGTVLENIRFFRQLDPHQIKEAAVLAHIHDEISDWSAGYQTVIGQRADAISGGQRQRLCLARSLASRPTVLILDEPTSALDARSEALVKESLELLKGRLTMVVIAHRISTLNLCDRIMVLRNGILEGFAPAYELARSNEFFRGAQELSVGANLDGLVP